MGSLPQRREACAPVPPGATPVDKADGTCRICGNYCDYKVTIYSLLETKEHPLPTPKELSIKFNRGQSFTKLDMSNAYQQ